MTITAANFLAKVNRHLNDTISGTTDADGSADKTTFQDSALSRYDDKYFGDPERDPTWWAYIASELRTVKTSEGQGGIVTVHKAFTSQVMASTAYELHRYNRDMKFEACKASLRLCFPDFYKKLADESTLTGKGASDTEYSVPSTFTQFPDKIFEKYVSGTNIYYTEITDYEIKEVGGTKKFYADITTGYPILLEGKTYLTQFTNDASTTELDDTQAEVVSLLAAAIFCRNMSTFVNAEQSERYDSLAIRFEQLYDGKKPEIAQQGSTPETLNWDWLEED